MDIDIGHDCDDYEYDYSDCYKRKLMPQFSQCRWIKLI